MEKDCQNVLGPSIDDEDRCFKFHHYDYLKAQHFMIRIAIAVNLKKVLKCCFHLRGLSESRSSSESTPSIGPSVRPSVCPFISPSACPSIRNT